MSSYLNTAPPGPTIALGSIVEGSPTNFTIEGFNTGNQPLNITGVVVSDPTQLTFSGWTFPLLVNPGFTTGTVLTCVLTPTGAGAGSITITINGDAANGPVVLTVTFTSAVSVHALTVGPQGYLFPNTKTGQTTAQVLFTIQNVGNVNCTISSAGITFPTDFVAGGTQPTLPKTLTPGQSVQFGVEFSPTAQGLLTENVSIASDATASPNLLNVQGIGFAITPAFVIPPGTPYALALAMNNPLSGPNSPSIKTPVVPFSWKCEEDAVASTWKLLPFPTEQGMVEGFSYEKHITRILFHYDDNGPVSVFVTVTTMRGDTATQQVNIGSVPGLTTTVSLPNLAFADFNLTDEISQIQFATDGATGIGNGSFILTDYVIRYIPKGERKAVV